MPTIDERTPLYIDVIIIYYYQQYYCKPYLPTPRVQLRRYIVDDDHLSMVWYCFATRFMFSAPICPNKDVRGEKKKYEAAAVVFDIIIIFLFSARYNIVRDGMIFITIPSISVLLIIFAPVVYGYLRTREYYLQ